MRLLRKISFGLLAVGVILPCAYGQITPPKMLTNGRIDKQVGVGVTQMLGNQVPGTISLTNSQGQPVQLSQYFYKTPILLNLMYYHCKATCTLETEDLMQSLEQMKGPGPNHDMVGPDVQVLTVSINPQEGPKDSQAERTKVLASLNYPSAAQGWHFLTGSYNSLQTLVTSVGFHYTYQKQQDLINHPAVMILLTPTGKISKYFFGAQYPPAELHASIAKAHLNKVGTKSIVLLLGCFCCDPVTGKYSANILQILRVLGTFTLLVVGGTFLVLSRRKNKYDHIFSPSSHINEDSNNE